MIRLLTAAIVVAITATPLYAEKAKPKRAKQAVDQPRVYDDRSKSRWYPNSADQLKFGSKIWLEQMEREGRFGGSDRTN